MFESAVALFVLNPFSGDAETKDNEIRNLWRVNNNFGNRNHNNIAEWIILNFLGFWKHACVQSTRHCFICYIFYFWFDLIKRINDVEYETPEDVNIEFQFKSNNVNQRLISHECFCTNNYSISFFIVKFIYTHRKSVITITMYTYDCTPISIIYLNYILNTSPKMLKINSRRSPETCYFEYSHATCVKTAPTLFDRI